MQLIVTRSPSSARRGGCPCPALLPSSLSLFWPRLIVLLIVVATVPVVIVPSRCRPALVPVSVWLSALLSTPRFYHEQLLTVAGQWTSLSVPCLSSRSCRRSHPHPRPSPSRPIVFVVLCPSPSWSFSWCCSGASLSSWSSRCGPSLWAAAPRAGVRGSGWGGSGSASCRRRCHENLLIPEKKNEMRKKKLAYGPRDVNVSWAPFFGCPRHTPLPPSPALAPALAPRCCAAS